ncbi:MAG: hypothetical protein RR296_11630 [Clostridia bacterium]
MIRVVGMTSVVAARVTLMTLMALVTRVAAMTSAAAGMASMAGVTPMTGMAPMSGKGILHVQQYRQHDHQRTNQQQFPFGNARFFVEQKICE